MSQETTLNYFRIKTDWTTEMDNGDLKPIKTEELVQAANYTDAEKVAFALVEDQNRNFYGEVNIDIIKTKITDVIENEVLEQESSLLQGLVCNFFKESAGNEVGLYAVKIVYFILDEKSGKEKQKPDTIYMPALSSSDAIAKVNSYMKNSTLAYIIRETKFDKCEAIYCLPQSLSHSTISQ